MNLADLRKKLHQLAETAHNEKRTAAKVVETLQQYGIEHIRKNIGGHGLLAVVDSGRKGPGLLFRAELDALPIPETIRPAYASQNDGIAHKCGHDGHMTILLGLARRLQKHPPVKGKVYLLFQPAEETGEGAERMLNDSNMPDISPDYVFALHNLPGYPVNTVLLREDVFAAGSSGLIVRLTGNTAHAAHPEQARSPASAVASLIQDWQGLPQKTIPFDRAGLLTIIHARIGEKAFGTTPGYAELMATIRAHSTEDLELIGEKALELAESTAKSHGLKSGHEWTEVFHPTRNHPDAVALVEKVAHKLSASGEQDGVRDVQRLSRPFSWSEDFGRFTERYPGAMFGLGAGTRQPHLHDTHYDFPDELLNTGVMLFDNIIDEAGLR